MEIIGIKIKWVNKQTDISDIELFQINLNKIKVNIELEQKCLKSFTIKIKSLKKNCLIASY